ncbi:hypothetical protein BKA66DRAFT_614888 [Pyrenochaeta sp. MPI-SDFR-AT-0127]|nr:hypothetical protein BKA66DRAFT_614888 [Pyrenochaeta sp. MPI-SDFR-AT-0127]
MRASRIVVSVVLYFHSARASPPCHEASIAKEIKSHSDVKFCVSYLKTAHPGLPTPTYLKSYACSKISTACSCVTAAQTISSTKCTKSTQTPYAQASASATDYGTSEETEPGSYESTGSPEQATYYTSLPSPTYEPTESPSAYVSISMGGSLAYPNEYASSGSVIVEDVSTLPSNVPTSQSTYDTPSESSTEASSVSSYSTNDHSVSYSASDAPASSSVPETSSTASDNAPSSVSPTESSEPGSETTTTYDTTGTSSEITTYETTSSGSDASTTYESTISPTENPTSDTGSTPSPTPTTTSESSVRPTPTGPVSFSGVNLKGFTSRSACSTLPAPTASLQAIPIPTTQETSQLQSFLFSQDGNKVQYLSVKGDDGKIYIIDYSQRGKLGIADTEGNTMYIDETGVHFSNADCSMGVDVNIDEFLSQAEYQSPLLNTEQQPSARLLKRFVNKDFVAIAELKNQCQNPVTKLTPSLSVGPTSCELSDSKDGRFTFKCQFPGEKSDEMQCEDSVNAYMLGGVVAGATGSKIKFKDLAKLLFQAAEKIMGRAALYGAIVGAGVLAPAAVTSFVLAASTFISTGITVITIVDVLLSVVNAATKNGVAEYICMLKHKDKFPLPLTLIAGASSAILGRINSLPSPSFSGSAIINDPTDTSCETCTNGGTCATYKNCAQGGSSCYCGRSVENVNFCFWNELCLVLKSCTSSSECGANRLCLSGNCCGTSVCVDSTRCLPKATSSTFVPAPTPRDILEIMARADSNVTSGLTPVGWVEDVFS